MTEDAENLVWYYGFFSAFLVYIVLSKAFPAKDTLLSPDELTAVEIISGDIIKERLEKNFDQA